MASNGFDVESVHRALERVAKRPLYRPTDDKWFFGVCGGIARAFNIDSTIVRAVVALAFFFAAPPMPLLIYLILVIVLPEK
ncbi:PspC domain-containing protein [Corynebacterium sp. TAE3-ERU12]|uniref:PspC domain-containing protein n=1 Tax=Corynebacterium sp. TAE3-ERU12 TaxID=2849491 RepID=UPI001C473F7D|nr:PspC domain-containing protein [Corynebacterium sp. TAE3-ERU12]MBV7295090.1 PspC domain-containing protein [Corynebacterium sp. TAE3-ERU12]